MTTPTAADREAAAKIRLYAHYQGSAGGEGVTHRSWDDVREDIATAIAQARADAEQSKEGTMPETPSDADRERALLVDAIAAMPDEAAHRLAVLAGDPDVRRVVAIALAEARAEGYRQGSGVRRLAAMKAICETLIAVAQPCQYDDCGGEDHGYLHVHIPAEHMADWGAFVKAVRDA